MMTSQKVLMALLALSLSPIQSFTAPSRRRIVPTIGRTTTTTTILAATRTATSSTTATKKKAKIRAEVAKPKKRRNSAKWDRMISQLKRYHKQQGHSLVPVEHNPELSQWCKTIRHNYRHQLRSPDDDDDEESNDDDMSLSETQQTKRHTLSKEKLKVLQKLEFVWNVQDYIWTQKFEELCRFRAAHRHCHIKDDSPLSMWVHNQKCQYRALLQGKSSSSLTPARLQSLAAIGFWDTFVTRTDTWNTRLSELQRFRNAYGHSSVPEDYVEQYSLGQWVMNQRGQYKRYVAGLSSSLTPDRIVALEALDFRWNVQSYKWFGMLERLRQQQTEIDDDDDLKLWVVQQRHSYQRKLQGRTSSMTDYRQAALESVPGFHWKVRANSSSSGSKAGPSSNEWQELFEGLRDQGIAPGAKLKEHWFEGQDPFAKEENEKDIYDDDDLLDLWNQEGDEEGEGDEQYEEEFVF